MAHKRSFNRSLTSEEKESLVNSFNQAMLESDDDSVAADANSFQ